MFVIFCKLVTLLLFTSIVRCDNPTIRQTYNGPVEGIEQTSILGKKYYSFRGIPYAEVPITGTDPYTGTEVDRRFKAPEPLSRKWTEVLKVHDFRDMCVSSTHFLNHNNTASEDCLYANIYVPAGGKEKKTVLLYIHGGAFTEGFAGDFLYGPDFLIDADNVLVKITYRVGIFGFLNLGFGEYTGNMGLKDQQMALKWVYENIEHFSGNKNEILLIGESAGGVSVNYQMLNEESRKYFNRAFAMSGTVFNYYASYEPNHLKRMQDYANIEDKNKLIEYLQTTDTNTLADCSKSKGLSPSQLGTTLLTVPWAPTIENPSTKGAFITKHPEEIYNSDKAPTIDAMFTFDSQEFITFNSELTKSTKPILTENLEESNFVLPFPGFTKESHPDEYKQAVESLREAYFSGAKTPEEIQKGNIDLLSDLNFVYSILKGALLQIKANNRAADESARKNTFIQRFSVNADMNWMKVLSNYSYSGAAHGEDICYLFRCSMIAGSGVYEKHLKVQEPGLNINYDTMMRLVKIVTNFARTGDPSIEGDTPFKSNTSPNEVYCQDITNDSKMHIIPNITSINHYDTWQAIEDSYKKLRIVPNENHNYCNAPSC